MTEFQLRHYGATIPEDKQPRCDTCGGYMVVSHYCNDWGWLCTTPDCPNSSFQHPDFDFGAFGIDTSPPLTPREAAEKYGLSRDRAYDIGVFNNRVWLCIDAPAWGGNHCASKTRPNSVLRWTGYKGQTAEEWIPLNVDADAGWDAVVAAAERQTNITST